MKKIVALAVILTLICVFALSASAITIEKFEDGYVNNDDVVFAAINGIKPFLEELKNPEAIEETCFWLTDYKDKYNIRYVSFNGPLSSYGNFNYYNTVSLGQSLQEMYQACRTDEKWLKEFDKLKNIGKILTSEDLPYGVSIGLRDYFSNGFVRENLLGNTFILDDFTNNSEECFVESYDNMNYATIVHAGNTKYIVYQLEAFPRKAVIKWFNETNANHMDKRAFVFTTSFADAKGEMYTQYDAMLYNRGTAPGGIMGNSILTTNMVHYGEPFDGTSIWKHAIANNDNVVMILSANAEPGTEIVTKTFKNDNGHDVVSVVTNLMKGYDAMGAYPVLVKFSEEEKTLDLRYAVPYDDVVGGYVEESVINIKLDSLMELAKPDPLTLMPKVPAQYNGENKKYINGYAGNLFKPNANMTRAEASTIFARLLTGSTTLPTGNTTRFSDVKSGDWYYDAIAYMDTNNFYYTNTTDKYRPNDPITRAEFVELAYLASDLIATKSVKFKDVTESHLYYDAIIAAAASGLVNGYEDSTFRPDGKITRAEVVTIINRMLSLVCNSDTISKPRLSNVFSDISGHWAEYQILMSANDNVHGESFYSIDASIFRENGNEISFGNKYFDITINTKNGKITKIIYLPTNSNILGTSTDPWFSYAVTRTGAALAPTSVDLIDGRLKFNYKGGYSAYFVIEVLDEYITVTLDSNISKNIKGLVFGNLLFSYTFSIDDPASLRGSSVAMDTRVQLAQAPGGSAKLSKATVYSDLPTDVIGAKLGIAVSTLAEHQDILKKIVDDIDPTRGISSDKGGPYATDNPDILGDYAIIYSLSEENVDEYIEAAKEVSLDLFDLHQGWIVSQGDFNFKSARTAEEVARDNESKTLSFTSGSVFKERIADKVHNAGLKLALHTYSTLVGTDARPILTNPKWQKDLHYHPTTYTLRGDLSKFRTNVKTYEDASSFASNGGVPYDAAPHYTSYYILIDEEIIAVTQNKGTTSGFMNVQRGQLGTKPADHKDGAEIRQLSAIYGCFVPIVGSELFWHIADETAKAYNEADFDMIYFDGFEGFTAFNPNKDTNYYYYSEFARRVLSQCKKTPMIEASAMGTNLWNAGGRIGAMDAEKRGYKLRKKGHYENYGINAEKSFNTITLGWFEFAIGGGEYSNVENRTLFRDDLDYLGRLSVMADLSCVQVSFSPTVTQTQNSAIRNIQYYAAYKALRNGRYFSEDVKVALKNSTYEHRLVELPDGEYGFMEMYYDNNRVFDLSDKTFATGSAKNPFSAHTPFIRIEQRYSTLGENEISLVALDETKDISAVKGTKKITTVDLTKHMALKVRVQGNGKNGAILISLEASSGNGRADYFIPTSHTGWREFILVEYDNAEYDGHNFSQAPTLWSNWPTYGGTLARDKINSVTIGASGDVSGVKIDDIKAYTAVDAPAKNVTIAIGSNKITFDAEVRSGEYIEFYPDLQKAYLNYYEKTYDEEGNYVSCIPHAKEISYSGSITAPAGNFSYTYSAESASSNSAPLRAKVVIGMQGNIIKNPESFDAPEIDMGPGKLEVVTK